MISYVELTRRAELLGSLLDRMGVNNSDIRLANEILRPLINKVLNGDMDLPEALPMQAFFYRQENSLPAHVELMNAVAKFDVGLAQLDRK